jgi:ADP-ribose pyrophosphatase
MPKSARPCIKSKLIYSGHRFSVYRDQMRWPGKKKVFKEWLVRPGICAVIPVVDKTHLILVRQYRYGANRKLWEVPAGTMNQGESARQCAMRECEEETGYKPRRLRFLRNYFSIPALSDEKIHLYLATSLQKTQTQWDYDEKIEIKIFPTRVVKKMLRDGTICDAKSLIALHLFFSSYHLTS